jgi:hypothetical protein
MNVSTSVADNNIRRDLLHIRLLSSKEAWSKPIHQTNNEELKRKNTMMNPSSDTHYIIGGSWILRYIKYKNGST